MAKFIKIKVNKDFDGYKKDQIFRVRAEGGNPIDQFWRRRLKDAERDNCVEIVKRSKK